VTLSLCQEEELLKKGCLPVALAGNASEILISLSLPWHHLAKTVFTFMSTSEQHVHILPKHTMCAPVLPFVSQKETCEMVMLLIA